MLSHIEKIRHYLNSLLGTQYDFSFQDNSKFYCVELIAYIYESLEIGISYPRHDTFLKQKVLYPFDLFLHSFFSIKYTSQSLKDLIILEKIQRGIL
jgi:hypothetical protein